MSNPLAIAAVTSTLRSMFVAAIPGDSQLADTVVTTKNPEGARNGQTANQLNAFLYATRPNAAWRNADMPGWVHPGESKRPALALDLSYLITAYGRDDDDVLAHRLLGRAMGALNDRSVLRRDEIRSALSGNDLFDQVESVRVTPRGLTIDEISKLWSAFQTGYRISAAYDVSVVLIESDQPVRTPLPVLTRGPGDAGVSVSTGLVPPLPTIEHLSLPDDAPSARLGHEIVLTGHHLDGDVVTGVFASPRLVDALEVEAEAGSSATEVHVIVPDEPDEWIAGTYSLSLRIERAGQADRATNSVPVAIAPTLTGALPLAVTRDPDGDVTISVEVSPDVRPEQPVLLLLGDRSVPARARTTSGPDLDFDIADAPAGDFFIRVRVDGVDSHLIDRSVSPPVFDADQKVTVS